VVVKERSEREEYERLLGLAEDDQNGLA